MTHQPANPSQYTRQTIRIYIAATLRHRAESIRILATPLNNLTLGVFMPFFASKVLADIVTRSPQLWHNFGWLCGTVVVGFALNMYGIRHCMTITARVMSDLHNDMFDRLLQRSVGFYSNQIGGKLVSEALDFVSAYGQVFNSVFINLFGFALITIIGMGIVFASNWILGACLTILLSALVYWTIVETKKRAVMRMERQKLSKRLTAHVADNIVNAITVKMFARESQEIATNNRYSTELAEIRSREWGRTVTSESMRMGVLLVSQVMLMLVLIWLTRRDPSLLAGGIFAFTYTLTLINRFFSINTITKQLDDALLQAAPMTELLSQQVEIIDAPDAKPLVVSSGEIICKDVTFHYADASKASNVFENLNLVVKPGEKIGLVGRSGGGKSTLTRLLLRFDDISGGSISIDGQDIREITQTSLREQISYVPQEPLLFHRSIRENIAYGNSKLPLKAIEEAARLAYAHDFIIKLPKGYDTIVGERGVKLSGGQRQRVAIARAMLKNAPILVLDEATSALDSESEKVIQQALWELMDGRTTVVIAHRLSTIQKMDRIVVLDNGKIVEQGSHQELLDAKGTYAKLWAHQSGGFIEE